MYDAVRMVTSICMVYSGVMTYNMDGYRFVYRLMVRIIGGV